MKSRRFFSKAPFSCLHFSGKPLIPPVSTGHLQRDSMFASPLNTNRKGTTPCVPIDHLPRSLSAWVYSLQEPLCPKPSKFLLTARTIPSKWPITPTLTFENFGRNERIAYPKPALELERAARHFKITRGTMTVYKPWGNIAIFLVDFPWSSDLADLGQISPEGLEAIRKSGDKPVTFFK